MSNNKQGDVDVGAICELICVDIPICMVEGQRWGEWVDMNNIYYKLPYVLNKYVKIFNRT